MNLPTYTDSNAKLLDKVIIDIRAHLKSKLDWLDNAFWLSRKITQEINGVNYTFPAVNIKNNEYASMLPNSEYGNYMFFVANDPQEISKLAINKILMSYKIDMIFWGNINKIYTDQLFHGSERLKSDIITALLEPGYLRSGHIEINKAYSKPENIFEQTLLKLVDNQFLMHPYEGLKLECSIKINTLC